VISLQSEENWMKKLTLQEAERSSDIDIKMVAVRASKYRVFGSSERIQVSELAVIDLRGSSEPEDFSSSYQVLDRHPIRPILLVRKLRG
jgi:hypothetical protein